MTQFETQTCPRCHGSGCYSYCQDYGDKCFKCRALGVVLTKRGQAARAYYEQLCTIPASQVKVGDRIAARGITTGCQVFNYVGTVIEIRTREAVKTTIKTMRDDGKTLNVSHKTEYSSHEGFSVLASSGATIEFPGCPGYNGLAGTFIEKFTEYSFTTTNSKYGESSQTVTGDIRAYPTNSAELVAKALTYQDTLTKQGTPRKRTSK